MKIEKQSKILSFEEKSARNSRVQSRYDELMGIGEHGHYETMFRIVHEECELALRIEKEKTTNMLETLYFIREVFNAGDYQKFDEKACERLRNGIVEKINESIAITI